jgi:prevent-host-death family protein
VAELAPMNHWKLQDARARFSKVVDQALENGPQVVTRHGKNFVDRRLS